MFEYIPVEHSLFSEEIGDYSSYGMKVMLVDGSIHEVATVKDLSDDLTVIGRIAKYCNNMQVNPVDFYEAVSMFV
jgi:hypothetical protein